MAEGTNNNVVETTETTVTETTPTVEELMAQLATAKADAEKYKNANDKLSKSEAEMKRQLRARLSAEEQEAEAQRLREEEYEALRAENNRMKATGAYKSISSEDVVENLIEAVSNADHNTIAKIIADECKKAVAEAETNWLKERPRVQHGQYSTMTAEQIMAIPDRQERSRAIAMNPDLF